MKLQEFIKGTIKFRQAGQEQFQEIRPRITCKDGVHLSVQASKFHYCSPRENGISYYLSVEVGFPSICPPNTWGRYFDGDESEFGPDNFSTVYGWVPIELVEEFIEDHGGIDIDKTLETKEK